MKIATRTRSKDILDIDHPGAGLPWYMPHFSFSLKTEIAEHQTFLLKFFYIEGKILKQVQQRFD
jgi:hypothetical protein